MRLVIDDTIVAPYEAMAEKQGRSVEEVVNAQLKRFAGLTPGEKAVVVGAKALDDLAPPLGGRPIKDGADLVDRLAQVSSIKFEGKDIQLTVTQKAELQRRAERQGRPVAALVDDIWRKFQQDFFYEAAMSEPQPKAS